MKQQRCKRRDNKRPSQRLKKSQRLKIGVMSIALMSGMSIIGCQPVTDAEKAPVAAQVYLQPSNEASADIDKYQEEYVTKMLSLQQSQFAEFEALKAADSTTSNDATNTNTTNNEDTNSNKETNIDSTGSDNETDDESSDLTLSELPLATTAIPPSKALTAEEHRLRYQEAMQSLYLPDGEVISAQQVDTLLNIATVIPDVFGNDDLARRLVSKSPALARLLRQYQIWEQIEAQQSAELEALQQAQIEEQEKQAEEFEALIKEFDATIKGYDEQIAKYEKMLEEFE